MNREQSEKLLAAYLLDELDTATHVEMDAALAADAALRDRLADMRMALKLVRQGLEEEAQPQLSEERRAALMIAVAQSAKPPGLVSFRKKPRTHTHQATTRWVRPLLAATAALAATVLLVVGITSSLVSPSSAGKHRGAASPQLAFKTEFPSEDTLSSTVIANPHGYGAYSRHDSGRTVGGGGGQAGGNYYQPGLALAPRREDGKRLKELQTALDDYSVGDSAGDEKKARLAGDRSDRGAISGETLAEAYDAPTKRYIDRADDRQVGQSLEENTGGRVPKGKPQSGQPMSELRTKDGPYEYASGGTAASVEKGKSSGGWVVSGKTGAEKSESAKPGLSIYAEAIAPNGKAVALSGPPAARWQEQAGSGTKLHADTTTVNGGVVGGTLLKNAEGPDNKPTDLAGKLTLEDGTVTRTHHASSVQKAKEAKAEFRAIAGKQEMSEGRKNTITGHSEKELDKKLDGDLDASKSKTDVKVISGVEIALDAQNKKYAIKKPLDEKLPNSATPTTRPAGLDEYHKTKDAQKDGQDEDDERGLPATSTFREVPVNPWVMTDRDRFSTFASDVDTASYTLCRSYLRAGYLPPRGAVRMEEFVNAFDYNYPRQAGGVFNVFAEGAPNPFAAPGENTVLLKIGVQGRIMGREGRKSAHLVFVIDTSGSMAKPDRLPLIQEAIKMLAGALDPNDQITLITYNREASLVLECVPASHKDQIAAACDNMRAGGPTNLLAGLETGYRLAQREFVAGRINRVILCTDGAANIGQTDSQAILDGVAAYRRNGITLTVAGFGRGGYNDELLETLAKKGDGSYMFIDSREQAREALVDKMNAALQTIAFDSRIQVEFNPDRVRRYRLIGYEKRRIADEDFRNDAIAAAEVGSGQSATALYEVELKESDSSGPDDVLGTVYVRYRNADNRRIEEISHRIEARAVRPMSVQGNPRFHLAACAAEFAEILRESPNVKNGNLQQVERVLQHVCQALPLDDKASELLQLIQRAKDLPRAP